MLGLMAVSDARNNGSGGVAHDSVDTSRRVRIRCVLPYVRDKFLVEQEEALGAALN